MRTRLIQLLCAALFGLILFIAAIAGDRAFLAIHQEIAEQFVRGSTYHVPQK